MDLRTEVRTAGELVIGAGVSAALNFACLIIVARRLGPVAYADFTTAVSVIFVVAVASSPLASSVARVVAGVAPHGERDVVALRAPVLRPLATATVALVALSMPVALALRPVLRLESSEVLMVAFAAAGAFVIVNADRAYLQGAGRFRQHNLNTILEAGLRLGLTVLVLQFVATPAASLLPYFAALCLAEVALMVRWKRVVAATPPRDISAEIMALAKPLTLLMLGSAVFQNADMLAVKRWMAPSVAGQYGAASTLTRMFGVLFVPLYLMAAPLLVTVRDKGNSIAGVTMRLCGYFLALCAVPLSILLIAGSPVMATVYGPQFLPAGTIVGVQGGAVVLGFLTLMAAQAHVTTGVAWIPTVYAIAGLLEIAALVLNHSSVEAVLFDVYFVRGALLLILLFTLRRPRNGWAVAA